MNVIFHFNLVIDGIQYYFSEEFEDFDMHLPRIGDHIDLVKNGRKLKVLRDDDNSSTMMVLPSDIFLVVKVVHNLNHYVTVYCEAD